MNQSFPPLISCINKQSKQDGHTACYRNIFVVNLEWITKTPKLITERKIQFKCLDMNKTGCMVSHLHSHPHLHVQFILQAHTLRGRFSAAIIYGVFPVPWPLRQSISLHSLVDLLTLHRGHVLKVRTLSQSLDHKTQEGIHLAFLAAIDFLSGETFHAEVRPELFSVVTRKHEAKRPSETF